MPTGYTEAVANGTVTSLRDFAMRCSRAMGATIMMRDAPMSAPIPERFEPSDYHERQLAALQKELKHLESLSPIEAQRQMQQEHSVAMARWRQATIKDARQRARYNTMIELVSSWQPPTVDHQGIADFMTSQLQDSVRFDCGGEYLQMPRMKRWPEWLSGSIAKVLKDIDYHTEGHASEVQRTEQRNAWLTALRDSLPKWFTYSQNNSFGRFHENANVCETVSVEAFTEDHAWQRMEPFFDHSDDCPCCGARWSGYTAGEGEVPMLWEEPLHKATASFFRAEAILHHLSGAVEKIRLQ